MITLGLTLLVRELGYDSYKHLYMDWWNEFLSIQEFADYHKISTETAWALLNNAKALHSNLPKRG